MHFRSDNAGPAHPSVLEAMIAANTGYAPGYGAEPLMADVADKNRMLFEAPEAAVYLVATGTAANSLALATYCQPWQTTYCAPVAHVQEDECNAPEFFSGGAKLTLVGSGDKFTADELKAVMAEQEVRGVHGAQRGPVTITQSTELGRLYTLDEIAAIAEVTHGFGQKLYMDGARFSNAVAALGCSPAEMTWKAGVDAVSFGGTKNGCVGVEAVILFDPEKAWEFELRRKRGAHLFSKHRYLSAQMAAYLADDLWLTCARAANANCARLAEGLKGVDGVSFLHAPEANALFAEMPREMHRRLVEGGAGYNLWGEPMSAIHEDGGPILARFVCDWSLPAIEIDRFVEIARG
ncbi:threonine aldolase family protein [Pseudooceanicola sp. LIPI14-2-Ac024]|uniref:threonine aldolase family protein n=1 Tax=Pseudooceanicola sp. LIPI14-2-Ac024 TaxID=3344875 RepID=UPI0035D066AC